MLPRKSRRVRDCAMPGDPIPAFKRQLSVELQRSMNGWDTPELCYFMRLSQPDVARLRAGKLERFSVERLIRLLGIRSHNSCCLPEE